jgi:hypothetical protein
MKTSTKKTQTEKPIVNHRWQMPSLEDMVDQMVPEWPVGGHPDLSGPDGHAKIKKAFMQFGEGLLFRVGMSLEKAAAKGIEQAIRLVLDPEYTATVKRRTKRETQRLEESRRQQEAARERWKRCELTLDEKIRELANLDSSIRYHEKELKRAKERLEKVQTVTPTTFDTELVEENVRPTFTPNSADDQPDDEWPDRITFD